MVRGIVLHRVKDYDAWREIYDGFADIQRAGGVRAEEVLRSVDDPNDVLVTHDFDDADAAKAFFASADLHDAMSRAGIAGQPQLIWFGELG